MVEQPFEPMRIRLESPTVLTLASSSASPVSVSSFCVSADGSYLGGGSGGPQSSFAETFKLENLPENTSRLWVRLLFHSQSNPGAVSSMVVEAPVQAEEGEFGPLSSMLSLRQPASTQSI